MLRKILTTMALAFPITAAPAYASEFAQAKPAPGVEAELSALSGAFSARASAQLAKGERVPVIVMLDMGPAPDGSRFAGVDEASRAMINAARESVLQTAFPTGVAQAFDSPTASIDAQPGPVVYAQFEVIPGFAILADAAMIERLAATPGVAAIQEDALSEPILAESNGIIGADILWAQNVEGTGTSVAILDTGVEVEHPMTGPAIIGSACFNSTVQLEGSTSFCPGGEEATDVSGPSAGDSCVEDNIDAENGVDGCFHGTHVASTAAGRTVNTSRGAISGVARQSGIVAVNVFSRFQSEDNCNGSDPCVLSYTSDQLAALEWLYTNRDALNLGSVNMSLGGGRNTSACDGSAMDTIIGQLRDAGIATVIASGNDGYTDSVGSPACISAAITVGATTKEDAVASFSNSSGLVDMLAPGVSIFAAFQSEQPAVGENCVINNATPNASGFCHWFSSSSGTSMATPHVAGAFALLRGAFPSATVDEIETALEFTGVPVNDARNGIIKPRIQVNAAHTFLANGGAVVADVRIEPSEPFSAIGEFGDAASAFGEKRYLLRNNGGSSRSFTITPSESWIVVSRTSGSIPTSDVRSLDVSIDPTGLNPGSYFGTVGVTVNSDTINIPVFLSVLTPPPINDDFANALPLSGPAPDTTGSNVRTDKETGEPNHGHSGGASVWWRWTAPFTGSVAADTGGSDYDTILGVYTGSSVDGLNALGTNDDARSFPDLTSRVVFSATEGTTYYIAVDGYSGATGNIALALGPSGAPPNDNFADAIELNTFRGSAIGFLTNSGRQTGEPNFSLTSSGSIWYRFTAPGDGNWRFALDGTDGPASIAAYSGTAVDSLSELASAQDSGRDPQTQSGFSPSIAIDLNTGEVAYIAIGRTVDTTERSVVSWTRSNQAVNLFSAVLPYARSVQVGSTATAFVSVYNDGNIDALNCIVEGPGVNDFPGETVFQTTDPATNALTGTPNTAVNIASKTTQTFVFGITPGEPINGQEIALVTRCANAQTPVGALGVNTFILNAEAVPTPDLIAIAATVTNNGIVEVPSDPGIEVFTVAAINIGSAGEIIATPVFGSLDLTASICETDNTGACLASPAATVTSNFGANDTKFYSIFVTPNSDIPFDPANNRIRVLFNGTGSGATYGGTNVAVRTQ